MARVNATGSRNLSLFSKVGPSSFRNLKKKKRKQEEMGRHPTGSRSSFPTKMASKYEEIYTEGNSVNDLTGFKAGKTLGKLTRKRRGGVASRLCPPRRRCRRWQASGAKHPRREFSYLLVGSWRHRCFQRWLEAAAGLIKLSRKAASFLCSYRAPARHRVL